MNTNLVTVGIPVYNGEKYLRDALNSILIQDYKNYEVIILDNASTDNTPVIANEFVEKDNRFKYFRNTENIGATNNFQKALDMCQTKYFVWLAHDDFWEKTFLSKCVNKLEENTNAILCTVDANVINNQNDILNSYNNSYSFMGIETISQNVVERVSNFFVKASCYNMYGLIRTNLLKDIGQIPNIFGGDYILLIKLLLIGDFVRVPEKLFNYRLEQKTIQAIMGNDITSKPVTEKGQYIVSLILNSNLNQNDKSELLERFLFVAVQRSFWFENIINENKIYFEKTKDKSIIKKILLEKQNQFNLDKNTTINIVLEKANNQFNQKDYRSALITISKILNSEELNYEVCLLVSNCLECLGDINTSKIYYEKALKLKYNKNKI